MRKSLQALAMTAFLAAHAAAAGAPIKLANPGLSIGQPQLGAVDIHIAAPTLQNGLSFTPSPIPALAALQPVPQLKASAAPIAPVVRSQEKAPVLPALEGLAAQAKDNAPVIGRFYDNAAPAASIDAGPDAQAVARRFDFSRGPQALAQQLRRRKPADLVSGSRYSSSQNIASPLDIATHAIKMKRGEWRWEKGSIIVTRNGVIKDGHHRYLAAIVAGVRIPADAFRVVYETREHFDWERMQWSIRN